MGPQGREGTSWLASPSPQRDAPISAWSAGFLGCPHRARPHWLLLRPSLQLLTTTLGAGAGAPLTQEVTQPGEQGGAGPAHPPGDACPGKPGTPSAAPKDGAVTTEAVRAEFLASPPPCRGTVPTASPASPGDLRLTGQQLPPPRPNGLRPAVCGGSTQVSGLHLRPSAWHPQHPRHQEPGHHLCGSPASL